MSNSVNRRSDSTRIDLISFDLRSEGREIAFTSYLENEEKQDKINSFVFDNSSNYSYEQDSCYLNLRAYKSVDKLVANVGEVLTYKVIIDNLSGRAASNIILQDNLPAGTTYIINSLKLNGYVQSGAYPQLGFLVQRINPNSRVIITFEVSINSASPLPKNVGNFSTIIVKQEAINTNKVNTKINTLYYEQKDFIEEDYYEKDECQKDYHKENYNTKILSTIDRNNSIKNKGLNLFEYCVQSLEEKEKYCLNLKITKIADKKNVEFNNIITYKIHVKNNEAINLFNIQLVDSRDKVLEFVKGSLVFNDRKLNVEMLDEFMNIGDLQPNEECIIEYKMKVKSTTKDGYIKSSIYAKYSYSINQKDLIEGETKKYSMKTKVRAMSFKTYDFNRLVDINECNTDEISIEDIDIDVTLDDKYVLKGSKLKDNEGKILSGYQLKFFGTIDILVQYSILNSEIEVRLKAWSIPFSSYLILPPDYEEKNNIEIQWRLENSTVDILNYNTLNLGANMMFYI